MRTIVTGFVAGFLSVLIFHQLGFFIANQLGLARVPIYNMAALPPFGVPSILSLAFWGGLWGIVGAWLMPHVPRAIDGPLGWMLFACTIVLLVNWFVVLPLKGAPVGGGFRAPGVFVVPVVYAFWGLGMWLIAGLVGRLFRPAGRFR